MKKLFLVMAGVAFVAMAHVNAKSLPTVANKLPGNLKNVITQNLDYPASAVQNKLEGDVWLKVSLNDDSKIKIIDLSATNQELGTFVKNQISDLYVPEPGCKTGEMFYLKVSFDLLNIE